VGSQQVWSQHGKPAVHENSTSEAPADITIVRDQRRQRIAGVEQRAACSCTAGFFSSRWSRRCLPCTKVVLDVNHAKESASSAMTMRIHGAKLMMVNMVKSPAMKSA